MSYNQDNYQQQYDYSAYYASYGQSAEGYQNQQAVAGATHQYGDQQHQAFYAQQQQHQLTDSQNYAAYQATAEQYQQYDQSYYGTQQQQYDQSYYYQNNANQATDYQGYITQQPAIEQAQPENVHEDSNTLMLTNIPQDVTQKQIEAFFKTSCLQMGCAMFESVSMITALKMAYVVFPSVTSSKTIFKMLNGSFSLNGKHKIEVAYSTSTLRAERNEAAERIGGQAALFGQGLSFYDPETKTYITGNQETIVHEDWICEYCDGKNFSRRKACYKCSKTKTINAKIVPVVKQKQIQQPTAFNASLSAAQFYNEASQSGTPLPAASQMPLYHSYGQSSNGQNNNIQAVNPLAQNVAPQLLAANIEMPNTSLMVRGQIIRECDEAILIDVFQQYAQVKDVRLIREKQSEATLQAPFKDFAFVEFFSVEDASQTLEQAKYDKLKIRGSSVYVSFSKFKRHEQYFESFFDQSQGIKNQQNEAQLQKQFPGQSQELGKPSIENISLPRKEFIEPDPINLQNNQHREPQQQTHQDREKAENELKRWEKEQQKIEKLNKQLMSIDKSLLIMPDNLAEYENVPKLIENKSQEIEEQKKIKKEQASKVPAPTQYEVHICNPCKRLFRTLNTLLKHQQDSLLHIKVSYEMSQKRARDENRQRVQESLRKESLVDQQTAHTSSQDKLTLHDQSEDAKLAGNKRRDRDEHDHRDRDYHQFRNERDHHDKERRESFSHKDLRSDSHHHHGSDGRSKQHRQSFDHRNEDTLKRRRSSRSSSNYRKKSEGRSSSPYDKKRRRY